jgi:ubiquinone/menaquinone biosynthesis C-methylase UbiE
METKKNAVTPRSRFRRNMAALARKARVLQFLDHARMLLIYSRNRSRNKAFAKKHPDVQFPPVPLAYDAYGTLDWEFYLGAGQRISTEIAERIQTYLPNRSIRYLEWGCGPGCIIRHMPEKLPPQSQIFATDYNAATIDWCKKSMPGIEFSPNQLHPPLRFEEASFDWVCGLSVLTHLSEENCELWLRELARVTRPNGFILLTTKGEAQAGRLLPREIQLLESGNAVIRGNIEEGKRMYDTILSAPFFHRILPSNLVVMEHSPGGMTDYEDQDLWVLKKLEP